MVTPYRPCEIDGKPCEWESYDEPDGEGGYIPSWDMYCAKCGRFRDWNEEDPP